MKTLYMEQIDFQREGLESRGVASTGPSWVGEPPHPEDKIEKENEEKLRKMGESNRRIRENEETFLFCSPKVQSLAAPLLERGKCSALKISISLQYHHNGTTTRKKCMGKSVSEVSNVGR